MDKTRYLTRLVFLISLTLVLEMIGLPQPLTGPLVNMMLFLTILILGRFAGMTLGSITPIIAAFRGQLPALLVPFIPFIIIGNILLVIVYFLLKNQPTEQSPKIGKSVSHWIGICAASITKFLWLYLSAKFVLPLVFGKALPPLFISMMSLPQLFTALLGGFLATIIYQFLSTANILKPD